MGNSRRRGAVVSTETRTFLRAAVRDEQPPVVGPGVLAGLVESARANRVQGYAVRALRGIGQSGATQLEVLGRDYALAAALHAHALSALAFVDDALAPSRLRWLVVKGPVLTELLHGGPGMRSYGDLDVIVAPADLAAVLAELESAGAVPIPVDWRLYREQDAGELPVRLPGGQMLDLHWHLVNSASIRRVFDVPMMEILGRAVTVSIAGRPVLTTDPVDTLLHLCLHAATSGGNRLLWLKDIQLASKAIQGDWDLVTDRARQWGIALPVAVMLHRASSAMGPCAPTGVVERLGAGNMTWVRLTGWAMALSPPETCTGPTSLDRLVVRATRSSAAASAGMLMKKVALRARERFRPHGSPSVPHPDDQRDWRTDFLTHAGSMIGTR